jgi:hypothetical protein
MDAAAMAVAAAIVPTAAAAEDGMIIVTGGTIHDPARVEYIEAESASLPDLPVVYEDRKPEPPTAPERPKGKARGV